MAILHFYVLSDSKHRNPVNISQVENYAVEHCFNVEISEELSANDLNVLKWIISDPYKGTDSVKNATSLVTNSKNEIIVEIGKRLNFSTPFSSNAVSICQSIGLKQIKRIETTKRYLFKINSNACNQLDDITKTIKNSLCDITSCSFEKPITSFDHGIKPEPWYIVDVLKHKKSALEKINIELGLSFDNWDLDFYTNLFCNQLKRNLTSVECFDLAQSNSEHSRHWFFKGILNIDGMEITDSLFDMIKETQLFSNPNNVIKFSDNSSAIQGFEVNIIKPTRPYTISDFEMVTEKLHLIFTAETHNFPTAICPFSGAATGTGGRIRDVQGVGRGGHTIAGTVGYSVGNLLIPGHDLPWEEKSLSYPSTFASPLHILIEGSNGCSTYGNKFGEPVICGFTRSFGLTIDDGVRKERREYLKPILFSGGMGTVPDQYTTKLKPQKNMQVIKIGGPAYRIGVGGGAASSTQIQGDNKSDLDFNAVQREDPEMEQKLNRLVRACIEFENYANPILSIHDQGAGGNGNVLKEIVEPEGAIISTKRFHLGDDSLSVLELWGAEYQENNAILCNTEDLPILKEIGHREHCPVNVVGTVTGNGRVILTEDEINDNLIADKVQPVDLDLKLVLENVPRKVFKMETVPVLINHFTLSDNLNIAAALNRVLKHPTVCSKRFLVNKVDRSVTGLIAQQQCVGKKHTPVADVAVTAISYFEKCGIATSIGEQPIKGLINPAAGARMTVAEALSNLVFAPISNLKDVKCSGNWMWPAKLCGEGVFLYETCKAMCSIMKSLGIAIDGGKDSLSMATRLDNGEVVKSPGTLVVSTYAPCPDITKIVTPDLKTLDYDIRGSLLYVDTSNGKCRLGGSILVQCFKKLGDDVPDIDEPIKLQEAFELTQQLIKEGKIYAGHDISDGGLATCVIEMAIAGVCGLEIIIPESSQHHSLDILFSEECGWVLEVNYEDVQHITEQFNRIGVNVLNIGRPKGVGVQSLVTIQFGNLLIFSDTVGNLCGMWEETSSQLEKLQCEESCVNSELHFLQQTNGPVYQLKNCPLNPLVSPSIKNIKVAVLREEGINGDREMVAALYTANFEVWDVTMQDLLDNKITLDRFRGIIFPGGFSYADVFGAAKGWAASVVHHKNLKKQFNDFVKRPETFSFGVCNGCQLMCLIGWIGSDRSGEDDNCSPEVVLKQNLSGRFESRFSTVKICESPSIMLNGMEGSTLGVWIAHGEGRFTYSSPEVEQFIQKNKCVVMRYVDDNCEFTENYPFNPNGSVGGVAGICSLDGRHLAIMPHPERCIKFWQWPYVPADFEKAKKQTEDSTFTPWFQMFINAYSWCEKF